MSADRTLMAIVRTSLSLIGFGLTIHTVFQKLAESSAIKINDDAPRNFGLALIFIGIVMLVMGIMSHMRFQWNLTARRQRLFELKLVRRTFQYSTTPTFAVAGALLFVGNAAFAMIIFSAMS
jgi:putative membrane protein